MSKRTSKNGKSKNGRRAPKADRASAQNPISVKSVAEFERYLDGDQPVIVDFWASWCGPCRMMAPLFEQVGRQFEGRVRFLKVSTEDLPELAESLEIRAIPTVVAFNGREVEDSHAGVLQPKALTKMAERLDQDANGVTFGARVKGWLGLETTDAAAEHTLN